MDKNKITEAADLIKWIAGKYAVPKGRICIDEDGIGAGVKDIIGGDCLGVIGNSSPVQIEGERENFTNLRSQLAHYAAKRINDNDYYIESLDPEEITKITQELEQIKRKDPEKDGKFAIVPKDIIRQNIGRSPDRADCLIYREYFELVNWDMFI